ncbi:MAG: LysR substrate-binding domain-containing protein [Pseudomonadota bacterium]
MTSAQQAHKTLFKQALASGALDFAILPSSLAPEGLNARRLFEERFVCLLRRGHPAATEPLTKRALAELRHIRVAPALTRGRSPADAVFDASKLKRDIALTVPSYQIVPPIIAGTDLVSFFPARWASSLDDRFVTRKSPIHIQPTTLSLVWHPVRQTTSSHAWARQVFATAAKAASKAHRKLTSR